PSWIASPSHTASVSGAAIAAMMTSRRSRGEIRSQKSRARSVIVDIATSHALRIDGEPELLDAVVAGLRRAAVDFLEASDLLELADEKVDLLGRFRGTRQLDLLGVDLELVDIEGDLVLRGNVSVDLDEHVIRGHLRHRACRRSTTARSARRENLIRRLTCTF